MLSIFDDRLDDRLIRFLFGFATIREAQPSTVEMTLARGQKGPAAYYLDDEHRRIQWREPGSGWQAVPAPNALCASGLWPCAMVAVCKDLSVPRAASVR